MKVIGKDKLDKFSKKHADAKPALDAWCHEVYDKDWKTTHDIKEHYNSADFIPNNRVIFNIKGNHYRLVVKVHYRNGIAAVEWVGTHSEYSKMKF